MLGPALKRLSALRVVLASGSPRRRELLSSLQLDFDVVPSLFPECLDKKKFSLPQHYAEETSRQKAIEVFERLQAAGERLDIVISADTVISLGDAILEKPKNRESAVAMLRSLSGRRHCVFTGVTVMVAGKDSAPISRTFHEKTAVSFADLSDEVIQYYVDTGEPMDKAGAYGIQGIGGSLVQGIEGDYFNVVGLPIHHLCCALVEMTRDVEKE